MYVYRADIAKWRSEWQVHIACSLAIQLPVSPLSYTLHPDWLAPPHSRCKADTVLFTARWPGQRASAAPLLKLNSSDWLLCHRAVPASYPIAIRKCWQAPALLPYLMHLLPRSAGGSLNRVCYYLKGGLYSIEGCIVKLWAVM